MVDKKEYHRQYMKMYYHEKLKNDPEYKAKQRAYHAKWQKDNAEKVNKYRRDWRKKQRAERQFFTPQQVRQMSPAEVRTNYDAIFRSMKEWK